MSSQEEHDKLVRRLQAAEEGLRESEARHRLVFEHWAQAVWETDAEGRVVADSASWRVYTGQTLDEWLGYGWVNAVHPDDRAFAERQWREAVDARGLVDAEFRLRAPGGGWRWTNVRAAPMIGSDGEVQKWLGLNIDIDARKRAEEALRESEQRLQAAVEIGGVGLWDWDIQSGEILWSDEHYAMEGYEPGEIEPSYAVWAERLHPEDRAETEAALQAARLDGGLYEHEFRVVHPGGEVRWLHARGRFFDDDSGKPARMIGAILDVTERRALEERQALLIEELQHRTLNLIGVVQSVAHTLIRRSHDLPDFRRRFARRLEALRRVQRLISRLGENERVGFHELLENELTALGAEDGRFSLDGPRDIVLPSSSVQTLALALHELATNARKYGALGQDGAHLAVRWWKQDDHTDDGPELHVDWRETGVAMKVSEANVESSGLGRELIERALPYQLKARTTYVMGEEGVRCQIALPIGTTR